MSDPTSTIREGMDVLDLGGDKIGTIARVVGSGLDFVADGTGPGRDMEDKRAGKGATGHIEVRRASHDLFIPFSAINHVRDDAVTIIVDGASIDTQGWDQAPRTA